MVSVWVYGARDAQTRSGAPFYFYQHLAAVAERYPTVRVRPIPVLRAPETPSAALRWVLETGRTDFSEFLLSRAFHNASFARMNPPVQPGDSVVSFCQILPDALLDRDDIHRYHYFDVTLTQYFDQFLSLSRYPPVRRREILVDELQTYKRARGFFTYLDETKNALAETYGVPAAHIDVIGRGANLSPRDCRRTRVALDDRLRLMCVGRDALRKGADLVIDAIDALPPAHRDRIVLTLAGPRQSDVPRRSFVECVGFMGPSRRGALLDLMASADIGVLLSRADALPASLFEFLTLGVPIWATALPGLQQTLAGYPAFFEPLPVEIGHLRSRLLSWAERPNLVRAVAPLTMEARERLSWTSRARHVLTRVLSDIGMGHT